MDKSSLQQIVFNHIIPGVQIKGLRHGEVYGNMNHDSIEIKSVTATRWTINDVNVLKFNSLSTKLISFIEINGNLTDFKSNFTKRNIHDHDE
jgi:hypothetical protein